MKYEITEITGIKLINKTTGEVIYDSEPPVNLATKLEGEHEDIGDNGKEC